MTHEVKENSSFERMQGAKPPFLDFVTMPFWSLSDVDRNKLCLGASSSYTFLIPPPTRALILVCKFVIIQIMQINATILTCQSASSHHCLQDYRRGARGSETEATIIPGL